MGREKFARSCIVDTAPPIHGCNYPFSPAAPGGLNGGDRLCAPLGSFPSRRSAGGCPELEPAIAWVPPGSDSRYISRTPSRLAPATPPRLPPLATPLRRPVLAIHPFSEPERGLCKIPGKTVPALVPGSGEQLHLPAPVASPAPGTLVAAPSGRPRGMSRTPAWGSP